MMKAITDEREEKVAKTLFLRTKKGNEVGSRGVGRTVHGAPRRLCKEEVGSW